MTVLFFFNLNKFMEVAFKNALLNVIFFVTIACIKMENKTRKLKSAHQITSLKSMTF